MLQDFVGARRWMVKRQLVARGIQDELVLDAMQSVPREEFVPARLRYSAYDDCALQLEHGQTISQPYTVAFMCEAAELSGTEKVLEVGTGSGYGAAVLSLLSRRVLSIDRIPELAAQARDKLAKLGFDNVQVIEGDGSMGLPEQAPFDAIVVTAGAAKLPSALLEQLAEGGRLVIPIGDVPYSQTMYRITRTERGVKKEALGSFMFVPLIGENAWSTGQI